MAGMSSESSIIEMGASDSIYSFNVMTGEYGLQVREGFASASGPVPVNGNSEVRTVMGFRGTADDGSKHKLFAVSNQGIYSSEESPVLKQPFPIITGKSGYGVFTTYVTIAGSYLFYADEDNGLFRYAEATEAWLPVTDLTLDGAPFDATKIVHVVAWKNRIWFTIRDSSVAYYLPVGQISGVLTAFDFGNKFPNGGSLVGIWNWTREGGSSINDYLVAISRGGDVLVYQGLDPSNAASFGIKGSWYVGDLPAGRSFVYSYSGDLLILTVYGALQLSALVQGVPASKDDAYLTKRITRFVREEMSVSKGFMGWTIIQHPRLGYLMITAPPRAGARSIQFVRASSGSWTMYRDIPVVSVGEFSGELYIGTDFDRGHKLYKLTGSLDNGKPIQWALLTSYSGIGFPANLKRVHFIRPMFVGTMTPVYDVQARYDFDLAAIVGVPGYPDANVGVWDASLWDRAIWGEGYVSDQKPYGGAGMGRHVAIALRGTSLVSTTVVGFDIMMDKGGVL
jgi:hypothetical protein